MEYDHDRPEQRRPALEKLQALRNIGGFALRFAWERTGSERVMLAYTRHIDPTWQDRHSFMGQTSRLLRRPPEIDM